jgi:hypothetical protein
MNFFLEKKFSDYIVACEIELEKVNNDDNKMSVLLCNIATAEYELELFRKCIKTCHRVLEINSNSLRAHSLHIKSLAKLGKDKQGLLICGSILNDKHGAYTSEDVFILQEISDLMQSIHNKDIILTGDAVTAIITPVEIYNKIDKNYTCSIPSNDIDNSKRMDQSCTTSHDSSVNGSSTLNNDNSGKNLISSYFQPTMKPESIVNTQEILSGIESKDQIRKTDGCTVNREEHDIQGGLQREEVINSLIKDSNNRKNLSDKAFCSSSNGQHDASGMKIKNITNGNENKKNFDNCNGKSINDVVDDNQGTIVKEESNSSLPIPPVVTKGQKKRPLPINPPLSSATIIPTEDLTIDPGIPEPTAEEIRILAINYIESCTGLLNPIKSEKTAAETPVSSDIKKRPEKSETTPPEKSLPITEKSSTTVLPKAIQIDESIEVSNTKSKPLMAVAVMSTQEGTASKSSVTKSITTTALKTTKGLNISSTTAAIQTATAPPTKTVTTPTTAPISTTKSAKAVDTIKKVTTKPMTLAATTTIRTIPPTPTKSTTTPLKPRTQLLTRPGVEVDKTYLENLLSSCLNSEGALVTRSLLKTVRSSLSCAYGEDIVDDMIAFGYLQVNTGQIW